MYRRGLWTWICWQIRIEDLDSVVFISWIKSKVSVWYLKCSEVGMKSTAYGLYSSSLWSGLHSPFVIITRISSIDRGWPNTSGQPTIPKESGRRILPCGGPERFPRSYASFTQVWRHLPHYEVRLHTHVWHRDGNVYLHEPDFFGHYFCYCTTWGHWWYYRWVFILDFLYILFSIYSWQYCSQYILWNLVHKVIVIKINFYVIWSGMECILMNF